MKELFPILKAMRKQKTAPVLLALQMAITFMVLVNAAFIVSDRSQLMERPSGLDEDNIFYLVSTGYAPDFNANAQREEDLRLLRDTAGVVNVTPINAIPLSGGGWSMGLSLEPGADAQSTGSAIYMVDEHALETLGLKLVAGEFFNSLDVIPREASSNKWPPTAVITQALAQEMFGEDWVQAVGQTVYIDDVQAMRVKGIIERLQAPWNGWSAVERSTLTPSPLVRNNVVYMVRAEPGEKARLMTSLKDTLDNTPGRFIRQVRDMNEIRARSYSFHHATNQVLLAVMVALTLITALGIIGQASFSVTKRTRQIGTRRALGATKGHIVRYFLLENALITSMGIILGVAAAIGLNMLLVSTFSLPRLPYHYLIVGTGVIFTLGQFAVAYPAQKAARISPAIATRSA